MLAIEGGPEGSATEAKTGTRMADGGSKVGGSNWKGVTEVASP